MSSTLVIGQDGHTAVRVRVSVAVVEKDFAMIVDAIQWVHWGLYLTNLPVRNLRFALASDAKIHW